MATRIITVDGDPYIRVATNYKQFTARYTKAKLPGAILKFSSDTEPILEFPATGVNI